MDFDNNATSHSDLRDIALNDPDIDVRLDDCRGGIAVEICAGEEVGREVPFAFHIVLSCSEWKCEVCTGERTAAASAWASTTSWWDVGCGLEAQLACCAVVKSEIERYQVRMNAKPPTLNASCRFVNAQVKSQTFYHAAM